MGHEYNLTINYREDTGVMDQMEFNVLRRAQEITKGTNKLDAFFRDKGIDIRQVIKNPDYYEELIIQYCRSCISQELYRESKERMEDEFHRLCEFHRRNEEHLVEKFCHMTKVMIETELNKEQAQ